MKFVTKTLVTFCILCTLVASSTIAMACTGANCIGVTSTIENATVQDSNVSTGNIAGISTDEGSTSNTTATDTAIPTISTDATNATVPMVSTENMTTPATSTGSETAPVVTSANSTGSNASSSSVTAFLEKDTTTQQIAQNNSADTSKDFATQVYNNAKSAGITSSIEEVDFDKGNTIYVNVFPTSDGGNLVVNEMGTAQGTGIDKQVTNLQVGQQLNAKSLDGSCSLDYSLPGTVTKITPVNIGTVNNIAITNTNNVMGVSSGADSGVNSGVSVVPSTTSQSATASTTVNNNNEVKVVSNNNQVSTNNQNTGCQLNCCGSTCKSCINCGSTCKSCNNCKSGCKTRF